MCCRKKYNQYVLRIVRNPKCLYWNNWIKRQSVTKIIDLLGLVNIIVLSYYWWRITDKSNQTYFAQNTFEDCINILFYLWYEWIVTSCTCLVCWCREGMFSKWSECSMKVLILNALCWDCICCRARYAILRLQLFFLCHNASPMWLVCRHRTDDYYYRRRCCCCTFQNV